MFRNLLCIAGFAYVVLPVLGQDSLSSIRDLNTQILQYERGDENRLLRNLDRRAAMLRDLMEKDPGAVLINALPKETLDQLQAVAPKGSLESRGTWSGTLEYLVEDDVTLTKATVRRILRTGKERLEIQIAGAEPDELESGRIIAVSGVRVGDRVAVVPENIAIGAAAAVPCVATGQQNTLAILVNLPDFKLGSYIDPELLKGIALGNAYSSNQSSPDWSVDDFWQQNSDGKTWVTKSGTGAFTVVGPFDLSSNFNTSTNTCDTEGMRAAAIAAADPFVNLQNYSRIVIVFPPQNGCGFAGLAYVGCVGWSSPTDGSYTAGLAWLRADQMSSRGSGVQLWTHELGHTLGLSHASTRAFSGEALGPLGTVGTLNEYGDSFSAMGAWNFGFYAAPHSAVKLNWLNYQNVSTSGTYTIQSSETRPAGLKALRIQRGTGNSAWVWVEYREGKGIYNSTLGSQVFSGALIHYEDSNTGNKSHLLDFTPATGSFGDPALTVGQTWTDPYSNLSITVVSAANGLLTLDVNYSGSVATCTSANPQVTLSPNPISTNPGGAVSFTMTVKNNDSAGCASSTFSLGSSQPSGWATTFAQSALTLAPGQSATTTLTKTPPSSAAAGTYNVDGSAADTTTTGNANATVNVTVPNTQPLSATLTSGASSYRTKSWTDFSVKAMRGTTPVSGASVRFTLTKSNGTTTTGTATTTSAGTAAWRYRLQNNDPTGTYKVVATVTSGSDTMTTTVITFTVVP